MTGFRTCSAAVLSLALLICTPDRLAGQLRLEDTQRNAVVTITGWIQPRYEYLRRSHGEDLSSFFLRRVRVDVQGHVFSERITFRIMPEMGRNVELRDGWLGYAFSPRARLRFGQFTVPFQWHRAVSAERQHFAERGVPSETFGFPAGRDVGVMFFGRNAAETAAWNVGLFDGAGRNVERSNSAGHMASGRLALAVLGRVPGDETDYRRAATPNLSFGFGLQGATDSQVRDWDLGRSLAGNRRADWITGTADAQFRRHGFSVATEGYLRRVRPDDRVVDAYTGSAFLVTGGYAVVADALEAVARWSTLRLDRDDPGTEHRQWGAGINIYHRGHDAKTHVQFLRDTTRPAPGRRGRSAQLLVQYHLQF